MHIDSLFLKKKSVLSFEIFPPKRDTAIKSIDETLEILAGLNPDFISVTYGAGGSEAGKKTIELAKTIKEKYAIEPVVHLTCMNHTKEDIRQILNDFQKEDIHNILALRGDKNPDIDTKSDFAYATELVKLIKESGEFGISGACYPEGHIEAKSKEEDIIHLKEKVDAGVTHLVSQLFFDNDLFFEFQKKVKDAGIMVPIEAGIMPVINKAQVERMVTLCGASIPEKFQKIMKLYGDNKEALFDAGIAYAVNQIVELLAEGVDGIHVYTMNNPRVANRICEGIKNLI